MLPEKEDIEDIPDADYAHAKRVCEDFEIKNLGEYLDLYVQGATLLLADVFENFRNMSLKIYELDPEKFLSAPGLPWQATLKKAKIKLDCSKANNKYMKDYDKNKESHLQYWDVNNLYSWTMLQKLPVNNFEWVKNTSQFNEDFIKNYNEESDEGYFLELGVQYLEKLQELHNHLRFQPERMKIEKAEKLVANLHDKTEYVLHTRHIRKALNCGLVFKKVHKMIKFN